VLCGISRGDNRLATSIMVAHVNTLLQAGESETVEFKERILAPELLARYISAFANSMGGTVLVGVREPRAIVGVDPSEFERMVSRAKALTSGEVHVEHKIAEVEGKSVGVIHVRKSGVPVSSKEGYFGRVGTSTKPLSAGEIEHLLSSTHSPAKAIESLSQTVAAQTSEIAKLRESFENANSWKRKALYAVLGAIAGVAAKAILGAILLPGG
jgi:predicted HTH transcriptional regulator